MNLDFGLVAVRGWLAVTLCLSTLACGKTLSNTGTDSATHWLKRCSSNAECGPLACICGTCTEACSEPASCPNAAVARCEALAEASCGSADPVCVAECQTASDCNAVRAGLVCAGGRCTTPEAPAGGGGAGGAGGASCGALPQCEFACPPGTSNPVDDSGCTHTCECVPPAADSGSSDCSSVPGCEFACPEGTVNPVDENGCTHSCECVNPGSEAGLRLYYTCGDPVCSGHTPSSSAPPCSTEQAGDLCGVEGVSCDPGDECNRLLSCASSDPQLRAGGCPISRQSSKTDIHYLSEAELTRYREELLQMRLATWKYKHDPSKQRLGFIIDDNEQSAAVDQLRNMVDLYGYTSMLVATVQLQAQELAALRREVAELKAGRAPSGARSKK